MSERGLEELFLGFRERGDAAALAKAFDATAPELFDLARHLTRDRAEAEDVVQATFLAAIENAASFDASRRLLPWLVGILMRQAGLARRRRSREPQSDQIGARPGDDPIETLAAREFSQALTHAIEQLSPADREVLMPLLFDGKRAVQIARELGRRPDTVHMRIRRGLQRLRRLLPAGFALSAAATVAPTRGLAAVRAEVMRAAGVGQTAASVSATAWIVGVFMTNKFVVAAFAVAIVSIVSWRTWHVEVLDASMQAIETPRTTALSGELTPALEVVHATDSARQPIDRGLDSKTLAQSSTMHVRVIESDGKPAASLLAVIVDAMGAVTSATTDSDGELDVPASEGNGEIYIRRNAALPYRCALALQAGARTIELPRGKEISGTVHVDGEVPDRSIKILVRCDRSPFEKRPPPLDVRKLFDLDKYNDYTLWNAKTGPKGEFRFSGLTENWSGVLRFPFRYSLRAGKRRDFSELEQHFDQPARELSIDLVTRPILKGRIVDAATHSPVAGASAQAELDFGDGTETVGAGADEQGRFEVVLQNRPVVRADIEIWGPDGGGRKSYAFTQADIAETHDLGDLALRPFTRRTVRFAVRDPLGSPLPGAVAWASTQVASMPADADGHCALERLTSDVREARVFAPGFRTSIVNLPAEEAEPVAVVLEVCNHLSIFVRDGADSALPDHTVEVVCTLPLFGNPNRWSPDMYRSTDRGYWRGTSGSDGVTRVMFQTDEQGRVELEDIRSEMPLTVRVPGPFEETIGKVEALGLAPSERREILVRCATGRCLEGRVFDDRRRPLANASIWCSIDKTVGCDTKTDDEGRFRTNPTVVEEVSLRVTKRGFAPQFVEHLNLARQTAPLEFNLETGHDAVVEVVDDRGKPLESGILSVGVPSDIRFFAMNESAPGRFELRDLQTTTLPISLAIGDSTYVRELYATQSMLRFELPTQGRVEIDWKLPATVDLEYHQAGGFGYEIVLRAHESRQVRVSQSGPSIHEGSMTIPVVSPGEYDLAIERFKYVPGQDYDESRNETVTTPVHVVVHGGESTHVVLQP